MNHLHSTNLPSRNAELEKLNDTALILGDSAQDIRHRKVIDRDGHEIGHVSDLFIDRDERKVRMLEVRAGGFLGLGVQHFLIPVDAITSTAKDEVHVNQTRDRIVGSPVYDPALIDRPRQEYWEPYYGYYGFAPYWSTGYMYPHFPLAEEESDTHSPSEYRGD